jgi:hypothetical protein
MSASKGNDMTQPSPVWVQAHATTPSSQRACAALMFLCTGLAVIALVPAAAFADVPPLLPIQGYLTDKQGASINGNKNVAFRLYTGPIGGTPLHEETIPVVAVDGYFTVYLGDDSQHPLDLSKLRDSQKVFLGIEVEKDGEGLPRLQIATTAFAAQAAFCGDANNLGGKAPSAFAATTHNHDWSEITGKPDQFPPLPHSHGDADIACYADLTSEGYLDNNSPNDLLTQSQGDGRYAGKNHAHDAGDIQNGILNDARYSAYVDLSAEGYLNNDSGGDLVVQAQGDMRYINNGEANSIGSVMLAPNAVQMDKTSAPLGAATVSQAFASTATTYYMMSGQPAPVDASGVCVITASVRVGASAPTGYFYTYPAVQIGAGPPSGIGGVNVSYGSSTTANTVFQAAPVTGMYAVSPGNSYQFGCVLYISSGSSFAGATFSCNTSWICN